MRLITFRNENKIGIGSLKGDQVIPFSQSAEIPEDMLSFLQEGEGAITKANDICSNPEEIIALKEVNILSPISRPPKIIAIGLNYADHLEEIRAAGRNIDTPEVPMIFNKQSLSANGPYDEIHKPVVSDKLDYEGELTIVIGQNCRHVSKDDAHKVIAGYTIANDVSVRDWQMRVPTFTIGKSFDTHCPFGPAIVTKDEIADPHDLHLKTEVNGEIRQESNTKHLIFNCFELIEHLSTAFTLEAGDLILTGTPSGVGVVENKFLKANDVVKVTINKLGYIENKVVNEVLK